MTFKNPLFTYIFLYNFTILLLILSVLLFIWVLRQILHFKPSEYRYRIKHFFFNWLLVLTYILSYLGVILWLRIEYINTKTDLKPYITKLKEFYTNTNIFYFIKVVMFLLLIILIIVMIMACVHKFFIIQLSKRFLILYIKIICEMKIDLSKYLLLFQLRYLCEKIVLYFLRKLFDDMLEKKYNTFANILWQLLWRMIKHAIMTLPTIMLYVLLLYNIFKNNCVISEGFHKYLLFYFIYFTYKRINFFLDETDHTLNSILYRMYYLEKTYWYVNIPKPYQEVIARYLDLGLSRNLKRNPEYLLDKTIGHYSFFMETECCFHSMDGYSYTNGSNSFTEENNSRKDVIIDYSSMINFFFYLKENIIRILFYMTIFCFILEIIFIILLPYIAKSTIYIYILKISDLLLFLLPVILLLYCLIIIFSPNESTFLSKPKKFYNKMP